LSPAGFPAGKGAGGSAAQAFDQSNTDETTSGEIAKDIFMKLLRTLRGKAKKPKAFRDNCSHRRWIKAMAFKFPNIRLAPQSEI
jgi:hypothetical protein